MAPLVSLFFFLSLNSGQCEWSGYTPLLQIFERERPQKLLRWVVEVRCADWLNWFEVDGRAWSLTLFALFSISLSLSLSLSLSSLLLLCRKWCKVELWEVSRWQRWQCREALSKHNEPVGHWERYQEALVKRAHHHHHQQQQQQHVLFSLFFFFWLPFFKPSSVIHYK